MTVGERIRKRRKELNLTQDELAKRMGYTSRTAISNVEKDLEDLTTTRVKKFANALETTPYVLMGWDNAPDDNELSDEGTPSRRNTHSPFRNSATASARPCPRPAPRRRPSPARTPAPAAQPTVSSDRKSVV